MTPMARKVVSDTLSLIFFGEALCEPTPSALVHFHYHEVEKDLAD